LKALIAQGDLVKLNAEVLLSAEVYREWLRFTYERLSREQGVRVGEFRDAFNTSRKYALAFLDYLEAHHLTRRQDDVHVLGRGDWSKFLTPDEPD
jgi:selenocysteine-specific elongation factor